MIRIPSFELAELNAFNFREYEWNRENIISTINSILSNCSKYNLTVKNVSIAEKPDKGNYSEIRKTISKILKINLTYQKDDNTLDIPLEYELPWLINNHFYIGGNYKVAIYQLYDKPIVIVHKKNTIDDLSAVVTGLLLALNLPVSLPWWDAVLRGAFAIIIVKMVI